MLVEIELNEPDCYDYSPNGFPRHSGTAIGNPRNQPHKEMIFYPKKSKKIFKLK